MSKFFHAELNRVKESVVEFVWLVLFWYWNLFKYIVFLMLTFKINQMLLNNLNIIKWQRIRFISDLLTYPTSFRNSLLPTCAHLNILRNFSKFFSQKHLNLNSREKSHSLTNTSSFRTRQAMALSLHSYSSCPRPSLSKNFNTNKSPRQKHKA